MAANNNIYDCYRPPTQEFVRGEGPYLYTKDGDKYLDFIAGIAVAGFGHAHPKLVEALTSQAANLWHLSNMFRIQGQYELAAPVASLPDTQMEDEQIGEDGEEEDVGVSDDEVVANPVNDEREEEEEELQGEDGAVNTPTCVGYSFECKKIFRWYGNVQEDHECI